MISGTGTLFQNGSGTTTISTNPSYTGLTTVNAGKLTFTNASNWTIPGNFVINGGDLDFNGGTAQDNIAAGGTISFGPLGGGTLSLNSVNFYQSSGTMTISTSGGAQSLISAAATTGNYGININGATLNFNVTRGAMP